MSITQVMLFFFSVSGRIGCGIYRLLLSRFFVFIFTPFYVSYVPRSFNTTPKQKRRKD